VRLKRVSWRDVERMCGELAGRIGESGFKPDLILGVGRGGWVPARLLSDLMGAGRLLSVRVEFYTGVGRTARVPVVTQSIPKRAFAGRRVLVVDDVADTGSSLSLIKKMLSGAGEVRVATLHFKPRSRIKPDFFAKTTSAWLVYPWEKHETMRELGRKRAAKTFKQAACK